MSLVLLFGGVLRVGIGSFDAGQARSSLKTSFTHVLDILGQPAAILASHTLSPRLCLTRRVLSATYTTHIWTQLNNQHKLSGDNLRVQPFSELGPLVLRPLPAHVSSWLVQNQTPKYYPWTGGRVGAGTDISFMLPVVDPQRVTGDGSVTNLPPIWPGSLETFPSCVLS